MLFWCVGVCVFVVVVVCFCWFVCLYVLLDPNVVGGGFFFFFFKGHFLLLLSSLFLWQQFVCLSHVQAVLKSINVLI